MEWKLLIKTAKVMGLYAMLPASLFLSAYFLGLKGLVICFSVIAVILSAVPVYFYFWLEQLKENRE